MAIPIEFFSVIVPKQVIQQKYDGGLDQYKADVPNASYKEDEHLTRVGLMDDLSLTFFCEKIISKGLHFHEAPNYSTDFVVVQQLQGKRWKAEWLNQTDDGDCVNYCN